MTDWTPEAEARLAAVSRSRSFRYTYGLETDIAAALRRIEELEQRIEELEQAQSRHAEVFQAQMADAEARLAEWEKAESLPDCPACAALAATRKP